MRTVRHHPLFPTAVAVWVVLVVLDFIFWNAAVGIALLIVGAVLVAWALVVGDPPSEPSPKSNPSLHLANFVR